MTITLAGASLYLMGAVFIAIWLAYSTWTRGRAPLIRVFSLFGLSMAVYLFGYVLEINSCTLDQMQFWNRIQYFGLPFYPGLWLLTALLFTGTVVKVRPVLVAILFAVPAATFLLRQTNDLHHLYYLSEHLALQFGSPMMRLEKGIWYHVHSAYLVGCLVIVTLIYARRILGADTGGRRGFDTRRGFQSMLIASIVPYAGFFATLADIGRSPIDYTAFLLPPSLVVGLLAMSRGDALLVRTLARTNLFEQSADPMLLLSSKNEIIDYNRAAAERFSGLDETVPGSRASEAFGEYPDLLDAMLTGSASEHALESDGGLRWYEMRIKAIETGDALTVGRLVTLVDMTDRKEAEQSLRLSEEKLRILASTDGLTGVGNRSWFLDQGQTELARSMRNGRPLALIIMDIDHFKQLNDHWGHAAGDAVLAHFGARLSRAFRRSDIVGRIGGEEFGVLLPDSTREGAWLAAEKFRESVAAEKLNIEGQEMRLTVSVGVTLSESKEETVETLLRQADSAMYRSKEGGRNRTTLHLKTSTGIR